MNHFSIKDIENLTGIKSHTLRIWEQRYGIPSPKRTPTNIRYYDDEDLKLLLNVSMLNRQGYKISKLTNMDKRELEQLALSCTEQSADTSARIDALMTTMFNLDEPGFDRILSTNLLRSGMEHTMTDLFFPFLKRVGYLWQAGQVNPAFEHFISNLIRQKLIVAIDSCSIRTRVNAGGFILFLPENETHEIGLLFAQYLIRSRGHKALYLGSNLPYDDLDAVTGLFPCQYIMTALTSLPVNRGSVQDYINQLAAHFGNHNILLTGFQVTDAATITAPKNVTIIRDFSSFIQFLDGPGATNSVKN